MKYVIFVLVALLAAGLYATSAVAYEEPEYDVIREADDYEIRRYRPFLVAETIVTGEFGESGNKAFRILAGYIFGDNRPQEKMAMTAPVLSADAKSEGEKMAMTAPVLSADADSDGEKMAMTAPVVSRDGAGEDSGDGASQRYVYQFVMERKYTRETLPVPNDDRVRIREVPGRTLAAHRFSGLWREKRVAEKEQRLLEALRKDGIKVVGEPELARYNGPFTPFFLRRNEILVEVEDAG